MHERVYIHPTAEVSANARIGAGSKIWHHAQIREEAVVGHGCIIGKGVYIDKGVTLGDRVKIQNGVSVYHGVTIEDDVFVGPDAVFTNDRFPRAFNSEWTVTPTVVKRGASIGANATIVCGATIGDYAMVGAGAVVTKDVPAYTLVVGNPARIVREIGMLEAQGCRSKPANTEGEIPVMLVGYGSMGRNHARVLAALTQQLRLTVIAETDPIAREAATQVYPGVRVIDAYEKGLDQVEAVVIATPTATHYPIAKRCLDAGKHCLVEKPLTLSSQEAKGLAALAAQSGLVLQVGHIERFNPAVEALIDRIRGEKILAIAADRLSPPTGRSADVDVVFDLMIHDLEIAHTLVGDQVVSIQAAGFGEPKSDYACGLLRYRDGAIVTLTASRTTEGRVRRLRVTTTSAYYELDYLARTIQISQRAMTTYAAQKDRLGLVQSGETNTITYTAPEPLLRQAMEFASLIRGQGVPRVGADHAAEVTRLAECIVQALRE